MLKKEKSFLLSKFVLFQTDFFYNFELLIFQSSLPLRRGPAAQTVNVTALNLRCQNQPLVVKTIRMDLNLMYLFLLEHPSVKVIHLIRDPRAVQASRLNMPHRAWLNYLGPAKVCDCIAKDLEAGDTLISCFPVAEKTPG